MHQEATTVDPERWPRCPQCNERRLAVCPICSTAAYDFPLADDPADQGEGPPLVICSTCDEPFYPQFYKLCEFCGHAFESGLEVRQPRGPADDFPLNWRRVWLLLGSIILLGAVGAVYFSWLLSR